MAQAGKVILRSGDGFTNGMITGYLDYFLDGHADMPLSDVELFRVLMDALCRPDPETYCVGYVVSFCEALLEDRRPFALPETQQAKRIG